MSELIWCILISLATVKVIELILSLFDWIGKIIEDRP